MVEPIRSTEMQELCCQVNGEHVLKKIFLFLIVTIISFQPAQKKGERVLTHQESSLNSRLVTLGLSKDTLWEILHTQLVKIQQ